MAAETGKEKKKDLQEFIDNVNKKEKKRNGLKIRFAFTKRKR
ncbi:hypothetical protein ACFLYB_04625 [Chloroflexota bacterium]